MAQLFLVKTAGQSRYHLHMTGKNIEQPPRKDYPELEGLRGFLALSVAINHAFCEFTVSGNNQMWRIPPLYRLNTADEWLMRAVLFFAEGIGAVIVFFAISGFVLAHAMTQRAEKLFAKKTPAGKILRDQYYYLALQRFFRIFPLHWLVLLLAIPLLSQLAPAASPYASDWYARYLAPTDGMDRLLNAVFLSNSVNPPAWSLFHETWPLVLFPLLLLALDRAGDFMSQALVIFLLFIAGHLSQVLLDVNWIRNPFLFVSLFGGGAMLYHQQDRLRRMTLGPPLVWWFAMTGMRLVYDQYQDSFMLLWVSATALLLVAAVVAAPAASWSSRMLRAKPLVWLGTRSYGFYILNFPVTYAAATLLFDTLPEGLLREHVAFCGALLAGMAAGITALLCWLLAYPFEAYWQRRRQNITSRGRTA